MWKPIRASILCLLFAVFSAGCSNDRQPLVTQNQPPQITSLTAEPDSVPPSGVSSLSNTAEDPDGDLLQYQWSAQDGALQPQGATAGWTAPDSPGVFTIWLNVQDGNGGTDHDSVRVTVVPRPNHEPVITRLTASVQVAAPGDTVHLACVARDDDGDPLNYTWESAAGSFDGEGAAVGWIAPDVEGVHQIRAVVADGQGGEARDTLTADVFSGTLLASTRDGLTAVRLNGAHWTLAPGQSGAVEVLGARIFLKSGRGYVEVNHQGSSIGEVEATDPAVGGHDFVILPGAGYVFLDNAADVMHVCGPDGSLRQTVAMPNGDAAGLQNTTGVVVGNQLIVSENGHNELIAVDLTTLEASIFRPIPDSQGWLGAIDYLPGENRFYLCRSRWLQEFTGSGEVHDVATFSAGNLTGVAVVGSYVYVCVNFEGTIYRVDRLTGQTELLANDLNYPEDLEYLPARLSP